MLYYPFLCWQRFTKTGDDINLCGHCCQKIKKGFIADLIQIAACMEISDLYPNTDMRLVRTSEQTLDHEAERREREGAAIMLALRPKAGT
jgi:hypothetical protein